MIVIGADTHKRSHALAAVDEGTGRLCGGQEIKADEAGHLAALRWARELDPERVWAIEDCRHVSRRLEQALLAVGERVVRVPPHRMGASRRGEREPGKSDQIDALAIARAVVKDGVERFPAAHLDERALEILAEPRQLDRIDRRLRRLPRCARARVAREQVGQLRVLTRQVDALERELLAHVKAHRPQLLAEIGCSAFTAALLIGRTAGAQRFRSDASLARLTGTAPIRCSSGQRERHRLDRGGDRQLNHALHVIAIWASG